MNYRKWSMLIAGVVALLQTAGGQAVSASPAGPVARIANAAAPLPGCAVTFVPQVGSEDGRTCLSPAAEAGAAAAPQDCSFAYYENGPYGSDDWRNGWGVCVIGGPGNYYVSLPRNDKASSWDSCASGTFYANQPGTDPHAGFPANSSGNFPWGAVPNDALSSAYVNYAC